MTVYAQTKLEVYMKDATDEKSAGLKTKKDHDKGNQESLKTLKELFKGNNAQLYKSVTFFVATYDTKTNAIARPWAQSNRYMRNAYMGMANWAYQNILRKE